MFPRSCRAPLALLLLSSSPVLAADDVTLAQAYKALTRRTWVDLTQSFSPTTPVWQGFGQASFTAASDPASYRPYTLEQDGFRTTYYSMVGQYGTHVDPPAHFHANAVTQDRIPLKEMILPLVVFDLTPLLGKEPNHALSVQDIQEWEKKHGRVPAGAFAALRTDLSKDWKNPERFKRHPFPAWSLEAVKFLVEKRDVVAIGHESLDTDSTPTLEAEKYLLGKGRYQIEVMAHLDQVPATGALIVASWPKVENGLGFPARVFAILP
ncbi:cyclase family protein [Archangium primigenium]|uniref:cyclase family protein n=1 Tax=[Archangium] primigenium TaxID=2792470 RepID=UPI0019582ED5|nr:cyclase family protein [Archangium primigenium]MBM7119040.1 cyclase family protein [Archangium primigenium]